MKIVRIALPDDLALNAERAGLLAPEALQEMIRERLRAEGAANLRKAWARMDDAELSPEDEELIAEAIRSVRQSGKTP